MSTNREGPPLAVSECVARVVKEMTKSHSEIHPLFELIYSEWFRYCSSIMKSNLRFVLLLDRNVIGKLISEFVETCIRVRTERRCECLMQSLNPFKNWKMNKLQDNVVAFFLYSIFTMRSEKMVHLLDERTYNFTMLNHLNHWMERINSVSLDYSVDNQEEAWQWMEEFIGRDKVGKSREYFTQFTKVQQAHVKYLVEMQVESDWKKISDEKLNVTERLDLLRQYLSSTYRHPLFSHYMASLAVTMLNSISQQQPSPKPIDTRHAILQYTLQLLLFSNKKHIIPTLDPSLYKQSISHTPSTQSSTATEDELQFPTDSTTFIHSQRQHTLQTLSSIDNSISQSFLHFSSIHPSQSRALREQFLSTIKETTTMERVHPILEKHLKKVGDDNLEEIRQRFCSDASLRFLGGVPRGGKEGVEWNVGTEGVRLLIGRDGDSVLELNDVGDVKKVSYLELGVEHVKKETAVHVTDLLREWRGDVDGGEVKIWNEVINEAMFGAFLMDPITGTQQEILFERNLNNLFAFTLNRVMNGGVKLEEDMRSEFEKSNVKFMGKRHLKWMKEYENLDLTNEYPFEKYHPLGCDVKFQKTSRVLSLYKTTCEAHQKQLMQLFQENHSSSLWIDDYTDIYQILFEQVKRFEKIADNSHRMSNCYEILNFARVMRDHTMSFPLSDASRDDGKHVLELWMDIFREFVPDVACDKLLNDLKLNNGDAVVIINELSRNIEMEMNFNMEQIMTHAKELTQQALALNLTVKIGPLFFTRHCAAPDAHTVRRGRFFYCNLLGDVTSRFEKTFEAISPSIRNIQSLLDAQECLINMRDAVFMGLLAQNEKVRAMEVVELTRNIERRELRGILEPIGIGLHQDMMVDCEKRNQVHYQYLARQVLKTGVKELISQSCLKLDIFSHLAQSMHTIENETIEDEIHPVNVSMRKKTSHEFIRETFQTFQNQARKLSSILEKQEATFTPPIDTIHSRNFEDILENLSNVCELLVIPSEDATPLTNDPQQVTELLCETLPIILFELIHPFPVAIHRWLSFILHELVLYVKSQCSERLVKFFNNKIGNFELTILEKFKTEFLMVVSMSCCQHIFTIVKNGKERVCELLFEMCCLMDGSVFNKYRFVTGLEVDVEAVKEKISSLASVLVVELVEQLDLEQVNSKIKTMAGDVDVELKILMEGCEYLIAHLVQDRLLEYHLSFHKLPQPGLEDCLPIKETLELTGTSLDSQEWTHVFLELDHEENASILQDVLNLYYSKTELTPLNDHNELFIYMQQIVLILGNYPFHKLQCDNMMIPYLHPIFNPSVVTEIVASTVVRDMFHSQELTNVTQLRLGKQYDEMIRFTCQSQHACHAHHVKSLKTSLVQSLHDETNQHHFLQEANCSILNLLTR